MSSKVLQPTTASDPTASWFAPAFALHPPDGFVASAQAGGWLSLSTMAGRLDLPPADVVVGFEVALWARNAGAPVEGAVLHLALSRDGATPHGSVRSIHLNFGPIYQLMVGSPTDLWGGTWTVADVRSAGFSLLLARADPVTTPEIDSAHVIVYHTFDGGSLVGGAPVQRDVVRQQILIGRETTLGTAVPANVRLRCARIQPQPEADFLSHKPAGEKLPAHQLVLRESASGPLEGIPTYDELGYLLASAIARPATATLATGAHRHQFGFDNRARDTIAFYTAEYGDPWTRAHRVTAMIVTALDLTMRQDGMDLGGSIMAQAITDGVVMTPGAATEQTLTQSGTGTFVLRFRGEETAPLTAAGTLAAADVQTALRALPFIGGSTALTVTGAAGGPFTITFGNLVTGPFRGIPQPPIEARIVTGTPTATIAMTTVGGHVEVPGVAILPRHVEVFLSPTLAALPASKLSDAYVSGFNVASRATPVYTLDRAAPSWVHYAEPSAIEVGFTLTLQANSSGMAFLSQARANTTLFLRILATGPLIGATALPHRLQIDCPVKVSEYGPFSDQDEIYAFEYGFQATADPATNSTLVITLDNAVTAY